MTAKKKTIKKKPVPRRPAPKKATAKRASARPTKATVKRRQPESLRLRAATPSLTVNDLQKSLTWYTEVVGFTVKERWERDGQLAGVELVAGAVSFYIGQDDWKKGRDRAKGEGFRLFCSTTQDIDALAAQVKAQGGTLVEPPHDQPWGGRAFAVADPDGFKITISNG
jgi:uncharacterized glyoxalase superfamily protein PhnB